jgi:hypothetical protein
LVLGPILPQEEVVGMARRRRVDKGTGKQKTAFTLSVDAIRKIGAAALVEGRSRSAVIEDLIARHLAGYVVSVRSPRPHPSWDVDAGPTTTGSDRMTSE